MPPPLAVTTGPQGGRLSDLAAAALLGSVPPRRAGLGYRGGMVEVGIRSSAWSDQQVQELVGDWGVNDRGGASVAAADFAEPLGNFWTAWLAGRLVGCVGIRRFNPLSAEVKRLLVIASARRQGVGRRLLATAETEARRLGYQSVVLDTNGSDLALALFRRAGYEETDNFNGNKLARFWFRKELG